MKRLITSLLIVCALAVFARIVYGQGSSIPAYHTIFTRTLADDADAQTARHTLVVDWYTWHYDLSADLMPVWDIRGDETDYFEVVSGDYSELQPITGAGYSAGWELDGNDDLMPKD